jgi:D,D-heptose 1,7-bisphosphate phosphatase
MKAVFLDRDGVINELIYHEESGVIDSPFMVEQFRLRPGVGMAIRKLNQLGYKVIVASNQPGVAKNHFTLEILYQIDIKMLAELGKDRATLDGIRYCLHHPEGENPEYKMVCACRKPEPGLLLAAAQDSKIDLKESFMIGDNLSDVQAGRTAGCKTILIGKMRCELCHLMEEQGTRPDAIAGNLPEAVEKILKWEARDGDLC